jgi:hypothetical protein
MAQFKKYFFEKLFDMGSGYVLDFSNITFESFIEESINVNIYTPRYAKYGDSKGKRLRGLFDIEDNYKVGKLLNEMLDYYNNVYTPEFKEEHIDLYNQCRNEVKILLDGADIYTDKLNFVDETRDFTIKELKSTLETDLNNRRFNVALDRLHTYCMKYFRTKAEELSIITDKDKPLHSVAGEVVKFIKIHQSEMTVKILKCTLSVLDNFNTVRNQQSLTHDNEILENFEAKLIVEWVLGFLNFFEECFEIYKLKINDME